MEYKFTIMSSELERARREYSDLQAKYELRSASYADLKQVCYQLDAQLNGKSVPTTTTTTTTITTADGTSSATPSSSTSSTIIAEQLLEEGPVSSTRALLELGSDRKKRRLSVDPADGDSDSGYPMSYEDLPLSSHGGLAEGSMVRSHMVPIPLTTLPQRQVSPSTGPAQSTWTCLWKSCNQVFGALDWLVGHVEEYHIGLGKVITASCMF